MINGLQPYRSMAPSGEHWIGDVPEHWKVTRLRNVAEMRVSNVDKHARAEEPTVRLCNYVDVYKNDSIRTSMSFMQATATQDEVERFRLAAGDVLITKDSEAWDDIGVPALVVESADDLICGYHLALLRPRNDSIVGSYLFRAFQSTAIKYQLHIAANGVTRYGLSHSAIKDITLPVPPLCEQRAITRLLDHVEHRIQRYIRAKQKLIKLLEEQKQAVIHRAVTRGLDPNVSLKGSGVEWLGDVPEHWRIQRNGRLFTQRNETGFGDLPILEVSLRTGVRIRELGSSDRKQVMRDRDQYKRARAGDIAYNMMRMWQGAVGVAPADGLISPAYVVAKPNAGTETRYFAHLFRTRQYMQEVDRYSRGIVKDRNRLYWEDFKQMQSCCPPPPEQKQIADALDCLCDDVQNATLRIQRQIALLKEARARLIADVVTGKLDVREAAARLPVEADEPEAAELDEVPADETADGDSELTEPEAAATADE